MALGTRVSRGRLGVLVVAAGGLLGAASVAHAQPAGGSEAEASDAVQADAGAQPSAPARLNDGRMRIGDKVPPLAIAEWVQGEPVTLETGRVYVVEFWATWCIPCRESIPHLTKLQEKYGDDVTIIGISNEEGGVPTIRRFVEQQGDAMTYRVAYDNRMETSRRYMLARGDTTIPQAFVIDREGRLAWHGNPMVMDNALADVVAGTFDVDAAAAYERRLEELLSRAEPLLKDLDQALMTGDLSLAIELSGEVAAIDYEMFFRFAMLRYELLLEEGRADEANAYARSLLEEHAPDNELALGALAWTMAMARPEGADLDLALRLIERAVEIDGRESGDLLDTLGRVRFVRGEFAEAVAAAEEAISVGQDRFIPIYERSLKQYREMLEQAESGGG